MVSKLEILQRFYQIDIETTSNYFKYQGRNYYLGVVNDFTKYYPMYLNNIGLNGYQIVNNCFNHPISMNHILYTYQLETYQLANFIDYSLQPLNQTIKIVNIKQSWCQILDSAKERLGIYASRINHFEHFIILFYYYQGLGESAISLLNLIGDKEMKMGLEHYDLVDSYEILCNPNNIIIASRIKDLVECYQKSLIDENQLDGYIRNYQLTPEELIYFYARLLFPSSFMKLTLEHDCQDLKIKSQILNMYQNLDYQKALINKAGKIINQYISLPKISWLSL